MNRFFGDESFRIHRSACKANSKSAPYDYEKEVFYFIEEKPAFERSDVIALIGSVAFSFAITASFIHPATIKDFSSSAVEVPSKIADGFYDSLNGLNSLGLQ